MRSGYAIEQIFVRTRAGSAVLEFVLVAPSGALKRETLPSPNLPTLDAVRWAARQLAARGDVDDASHARLRVERSGGVHDDADLLAAFRSAFAEALA